MEHSQVSGKKRNMEVFSRQDNRLSSYLIVSVILIVPALMVILLIYAPEINFSFVIPVIGLSTASFMSIFLYVLMNSQTNPVPVFVLFIISSIPLWFASDVLFPMLVSWGIALALVLNIHKRWKTRNLQHGGLL